VPAAFAVTSPFEVEFPTEILNLLFEDQRTWAEMSRTLPPEKVPVATSCCVSPTESVTGVGSTSIATSDSFVTVIDAEPTTPASVAETTAEPVPEPDTRPSVPGAFETDAREVADEVQTTSFVRSRLEPSL